MLKAFVERSFLILFEHAQNNKRPSGQITGSPVIFAAGFISAWEILFFFMAIFLVTVIFIFLLSRLAKWTRRNAAANQKMGGKTALKMPVIVSVISGLGGVALIAIEHATRRPQDYPINPPYSIWLRLGAVAAFGIFLVTTYSEIRSHRNK